MPRVLIVAHHYPPHIGGIETVVSRQARSMAENGYHVTVLTSSYRPSDYGTTNSSTIEVIRVPCWHLFETFFSIVFPLFSPSLLFTAWRQLKRAQLVHIHDVFYMSSWASGILAVLAGRPIVLTQHVALVSHSSSFVMLMQRLVYATAGRWIFSKARAIVVYNSRVQAFLRSQGVRESRILLMANGIDTEEFHPAMSNERVQIRTCFGLPGNRPLVLFVGRLIEQKGYHLLLEARDPTFDLVFVGPGSSPKNSLDPNIHWIGPLEHSKICDIYRACDLFAFPAVGEVFPLVIQEAMASGLPIVTTKEPAYAESQDSDSIVLCRRDSASFKVAILDLLTNTELRSELGSHGRKLAVQRFDWRANFTQLLELYANLLGSKAGANAH